MEIGRKKERLSNGPETDKWTTGRLRMSDFGGKECSDLDCISEIMPTKFERNLACGKEITRDNKDYVQNE